MKTEVKIKYPALPRLPRGKKAIAREKAFRARADYVSTLNDLNHEYGTSFTPEGLLHE